MIGKLGSKVSLKEGEVCLVVGGRRFVVDAGIFKQHPDTMLGRMFGSSLQTQMSRANEEGEYVLSPNTPPAVFRAILDFYKNGRMQCPSNVSISQFRDACSYFLIPFDQQSIKCNDLGSFLHELSNNGARNRFEEFLDSVVMSAMAKSAQACGCVG